MIRLANITFPIGESKILDGLNLNVNEGESTFIIGRNGAGKSTLLNIIAGEISNFKGVNKIVSNKIIKISQFSKNDYINHLSAFSNLLIICNLSFGNKEIKRLSNYTCINSDYLKTLNNRFYNIDLSKSISELTNIEISFINLYRIYLTKPEIILLDEPTALLIGKEIEDFNLYLKQFIKTNHTTMVYVTHNLENLKTFEATLYELYNKKLQLIRNTAHNSGFA